MSDNPLQGTPEWLMERIGCLTASRFSDAIDRLKPKKGEDKGAPSKACTDYMMELVAERMTGSAASHFVTDAMKHGTETEPEARSAYECATGNFVALTGFHLHPSIQYCGASPDGLVGDDGLLEIKCPTTAKYLRWVEAGEVPDEHKPQMLLQLACTGRKWVDFCAYEPRIKSHKHRLFIRRYQPSQEEIQCAEAQAEDFLAAVDALFDRVTQTQMFN